MSGSDEIYKLGQLELIEELIRYLYDNHEHAATLAHEDDELFEKLEELMPRPYVDSLSLEAWLKKRRDELSPDGKYTGPEWFEKKE